MVKNCRKVFEREGKFIVQIDFRCALGRRFIVR